MTFYPGNVSATCPTRNKPDCNEKKRKQRSERGNTSVTIKRHAVSVMRNSVCFSLPLVIGETRGLSGMIQRGLFP